MAEKGLSTRKTSTGKIRKVVVTGGAGFIGSHLAEGLAKEGYYVIILDDLSTGKKENIESPLKDDSAELIEGSVTDLPLLQGLFQGIDYIFHLAAIASVPSSVKNPQASHEVNATGTLNVLLAARDNHVKKVIYASSAAVYGDTAVNCQAENLLPGPLSPYAVTKLAGEYYCHAFRHVYGLPTICLRYFNVYGPRQDPNSQYAAVIPIFIQTIGGGKPPVIFGDGEQTRDFVFVRDIVRANIMAAGSEVTGTFNIASGEAISVNKLAGVIIRLMGGNLQPVYREPRPGDIYHSLADISRAASFGYQPQYRLEDGLKRTVEEFRPIKIESSI